MKARYLAYFVVILLALLTMIFLAACTETDDGAAASSAGTPLAESPDGDDDDGAISDDDDNQFALPEMRAVESAAQGALTFGNAAVEYVAGGMPGFTGTSVARDSGGGLHVAAAKGKFLSLYTDDGFRDWTSETVSYFADDPDLALDSNDNRHIVFHDWANNSIRYVEDVSGTWEIVDLRTGIYSSDGLSIALDLDDNAHVVFQDDDTQNIYYGTNASGVWVIEWIARGTSCSIAVDDFGNAHVGYLGDHFADRYNIDYLTNQSGSWVKEVVESYQSLKILDHPKIAVDGNGTVFFAYEAVMLTGIDYDSCPPIPLPIFTAFLGQADNSTGTWINRVVAFWSPLDSDTFAIDVDRNHRVHIGYRTESQSAGYATDQTGVWWGDPITGTSGGGSEIDLVADETGTITISHQNEDAYTLEAAQGTAGFWQGWRNSTIDNAGRVAIDAAMAVDTSSAAHVALFEEGGGNLLYGTNRTGSWVIEAVETRDVVGRYPHIAVDTQGTAHISYYDETRMFLRYATNAAGTWNMRDIANLQSGGGESDIAVDSDGFVHIAFDSFGVRHVTNRSGQWRNELVDLELGSFNSVAIAVDGQDNIGLAYNHTDNGLTFATNSGGTWVISRVIPSSVVYAGSFDLVFDAAGNGIVSFADGNSNTVQIATNQSGAWVTEIVASQASPNAVAVDDDGFVHVVGSHDGLVHWTNASGAWVEEAVLPVGWDGMSYSVAVDDQGNCRVGYVDSGAYWYAEFPVD